MIYYANLGEFDRRSIWTKKKKRKKEDAQAPTDRSKKLSRFYLVNVLYI